MKELGKESSKKLYVKPKYLAPMIAGEATYAYENVFFKLTFQAPKFQNWINSSFQIYWNLKLWIPIPIPIKIVAQRHPVDFRAEIEVPRKFAYNIDQLQFISIWLSMLRARIKRNFEQHVQVLRVDCDNESKLFKQEFRFGLRNESY